MFPATPGSANRRHTSPSVLSFRAAQQEFCRPTMIVAGGGGAFLHPTHCPAPKQIHVGVDEENEDKLSCWYKRMCSYPSPLLSHGLALQNVFDFRARNLGFDIFGALAYFLFVFSSLPLCDIPDFQDLKNSSWIEFASIFGSLCVDVVFQILETSYVSGCAVLISMCWKTF